MLGMALVACDDYKEPNPPAQTNPAPEVLKPTDVAVGNQLSQSVYELAALETLGENLVIATLSSEKLSEGYEFETYAYISNDGFENSYPITTKTIWNEELNAWQIEVAPTELSDVYHENIAWDNDEATIQIRYQIATIYGTQVAYLGDKDDYYGPYDLTFIPIEVDLHFYYLYTPGAANDWTQGESQQLSTNDFVNYSGFAYLSSDGFKFTSADNWDGINYGAGAEEGTLDTDPEAGNLTVDETGLYWCDVNIEELTYSATLINSVSLIGGFNDWGGDVELTPSDDFLVWTGTLVLESDSEWKFRMNNDWTINLGGTDNNLTNGGDNLSNEAGTYTVTLDLSKLPYSCTVVAE